MIALEVVGIDLAGSPEQHGWLLGQGRRALEEIAARHSLSGEVRVRAVPDAEMAALHARTLNIPETTDVLTFDLLEGDADRAGRIDADIVICVDEAARQAAARGHSVERELLLYIVHGVLHCVPGFDDVTERGADAMHRAEDEILTAIGVGAVFGA